MRIVLTNVHPEDVLTLHEVAGAMKKVADRYGLSPQTLGGLPPEQLDHRADRLAECSVTGDIRLSLRFMDHGVWAASPRPKDEIYEDAAHELAHLKHMHHGIEFQELEHELIEAMSNKKENHRDKIIAKIVKMQAQRDGEAALGHTKAAENFAEQINKMLIAYELNPTDLDYASASDRDPVIERWVDLGSNGIKTKRVRCAWQETLAGIVARANICRFLIQTGSNNIKYVGTEAHVLVAEYTYVTLVRAAEKLSEKAWVEYWREGGGRVADKGFRPGWLDGFVHRISQRLDEARKAAVEEYEKSKNAGVVPIPVGGQSTALIRLSGAMRKVDDYMDNKFRGRSVRSASMLRGSRSYNTEGRSRGRSAADAIPLGRKGLTGSTGGPKGYLK